MPKFDIVYNKKIVPDAYHGTSRSNAQNIIKTNKFFFVGNENSFLGDGVYFYESSIWHARKWAIQRFGPSITQYAILQAVIDLGRCLDLHNKEHTAFIRTITSQLKAKGVDNITDTLVINFICKLCPQIDTVRTTFIKPEYNKIFSSSRYFDFTQLIICIKNSSNIISFSIVE